MKTFKLVNNLHYVIHSSISRSNASAIADTGASRNYLKADAPHDRAIWPVAPIKTKQPNGQILKSTKGCKLELATLPEEARESHILPGLAHSSLYNW